MNEKYITIKNTDNEVCWPETHADQVKGLDIMNIPSSGDVAGIRTTVANIVNAASNTLNSDPWGTYIRSTVDSTNIYTKNSFNYEFKDVVDSLNRAQGDTIGEFIMDLNSKAFTQENFDAEFQYVVDSLNTTYPGKIGWLMMNIVNAEVGEYDMFYDWPRLNKDKWDSYISTTVDSTNIVYNTNQDPNECFNTQTVSNILNTIKNSYWEYSYSNGFSCGDNLLLLDQSSSHHTSDTVHNFLEVITNTLNTCSNYKSGANRGKTFVLKLIVDENGNKTLNWVAED